MALHDVRFVEDDWESPTLGAWGLGWECWCDGMEVSQFTYFQQVAGFECAPVSGELTYGLERLAMYVQGVDSVYDINFNGLDGAARVTYGDVFQQAEQEYSRFNFEYANTDVLIQHFKDAEAECVALLERGAAGDRHLMALPAYDQCIKASHVFNLLDARGAISVTERQSYILRVRELAKACGAAWLTDGGRGRVTPGPLEALISGVQGRIWRRHIPSEEPMTSSTVFTSNRSQAVRLPKAVAFPEEVHHVDILKIGPSRVIAPQGRRWDDLFLNGPRLTDDFPAERHQPKTEAREPF